MDLHACETITVQPGQRVHIPTGLAVELPAGTVMLIWDKSGLANKHGITNFAGVIDAGYRGEVGIISYNSGTEPHTFAAGDKIAQALIQQVEQVEIVEVDELSQADRGTGGFGSTGT